MVPRHVAVTSAEPWGKVEIARLAFPPVRVTVPRFVVPAVKVTVPVTLAVGLVTATVKVMVCPKVEGFMEDLIDVLVVA